MSSKNRIKETNAPKSTTQLLKPSDSSHRRCVCIDLRIQLFSYLRLLHVVMTQKAINIQFQTN